jgi:hypothetical protein
VPWGIRSFAEHPLNQERWAEDRQYGRSDAHDALAAFRRGRGRTLGLLRGLSAEQWERGGIHLRHGRLPLRLWVERLAAHDVNHLDQLRRAADGRA